MFHKFIKFNMVICMKVTGETFSFHHKRKRAEGVRYQNYPNFQVKGQSKNSNITFSTFHVVTTFLILLFPMAYNGFGVKGVQRSRI